MKRLWKALGLYFGVLFGMGWPLVTSGVFGPDRAAAWQACAVVVGGAVVACYTWEADELRRATHRQTEVMLRPFVVMNRADKPGAFIIENVGQGLALNITVSPVRIGTFGVGGTSGEIVVHFPEAVPLLRSGESCTLVAESRINGERVLDAFSANLDPEYTKAAHRDASLPEC